MHFPIVLLLIVSQLLRVCKGAQTIFKTTNVECITYPKYSENSSCFVKAISWNKAVAQMEVDLKRTLRNVSVHLEVFQKGYTNRYHPFLINVQFNFCDIISKKNYLTYGTMFFKILKPISNLNHSCPFKGHLTVRNLYLDETLIPIVPLGFYLFSMKFIENLPSQASESVGDVKFYVQAMEKVEIKRKPKL